MTEPTFQAKAGKFVFSWPDYKLQAEASRIRINHTGARCLLIFTSTHEQSGPHILQTRFNLESARARSELAKELTARYQIGEPIAWKEILEYLSVKTIREYEKGEPVVLIKSTDEVKPLEYFIYPLAPLNKPTVIFGDPGAGKSLFAVILSIVALLPWHDNPLRLAAPKAPIKTLFLDYESDPDDIRRQLASLTRGMNLSYIELHYRRCSLPLADDLEVICRNIDEVGAQCLIIDSASLAAGDDLNRMDVATAYFRALRQLNMTTISLSHTSKERESKSKTILGSVLWEAGARSVIECRGQEDEDTLDIVLFHRKSNLAKKFKPLGYRISFHDDLPINITWHDPKSVPEFLERMKNSDRIVALLKAGSLTMKEITDTLKISYQAAYYSLKALEKKNLVKSLDDKNWGLFSDTY